MISKLEPIKSFDCGDTPQANMRHHSYHNDCINKINELVDAVNKLHEESENNARIRANHENLIDTLVQENNIHEKQIDELQMKAEPKTELARTRKALDVAVDALKEIDKTRSVANHKIGTQDKTLNSGIAFCWTTPDEIHNALVEITAQEQKE